MKYQATLGLADRIGVSNIAACLWALLAAILAGVGHRSFNPLVSAIAFPFLCMALIPVCLILTSFFGLVRGAAMGTWFRWTYFLVIGGAIGVGMPFFLFPIIPMTPKVGGVTGLLAGFACAWLWGYVQRYRDTHPFEEEARARVFFKPSWLTKKT